MEILACLLKLFFKGLWLISKLLASTINTDQSLSKKQFKILSKMASFILKIYLFSKTMAKFMMKSRGNALLIA